MKAVIMAAGKSTRTYPLTLTRPKALLPVANKPVLQHQLEALEGLVDGVVVVVGYRHEMIRAAFGDAFDGLPIEYVVQAEQRGTGHAILQCESFVDGAFLAMNGDDLYDPVDLAALAGRENAALAKRVMDPRLYGIYEVDSSNRVIRLVEKPTELFSDLANIGVYRFTPAVFDALRGLAPSERGEIELTGAVQALAEQDGFHVVETRGYWLPIGYPWHLLDANEHVLASHLEPVRQGDVADGVTISGTVSIGHGSVIRPGVVIDGPVCIGDHCTVGPNCWLRPGTTLGHNARVGQGCEIKNSILFEGAAVPHLSYVGDSILGANVNFGCGTVVANLRHDGKNVKSLVQGKAVDTGRRKFGAVIGDDVHTGINTSIFPGRKIWPGQSTLPGQQVQRDIMGT